MMRDMTVHGDLLGGPPPTLLPPMADADTALGGGDDPSAVAARFPTHCASWALLADRAYAEGRVVESYAYARTGYHRGLDALRRNGWKGYGPVPWSHEGNHGFLRALNALGRAACDIDEADEAKRCADLLRECDPIAFEHVPMPLSIEP